MLSFACKVISWFKVFLPLTFLGVLTFYPFSKSFSNLATGSELFFGSPFKPFSNWATSFKSSIISSWTVLSLILIELDGFDDKVRVFDYNLPMFMLSEIYCCSAVLFYETSSDSLFGNEKFATSSGFVSLFWPISIPDIAWICSDIVKLWWRLWDRLLGSAACTFKVSYLITLSPDNCLLCSDLGKLAGERSAS